MSRIRIVVLSLSVVLAVSAMASGSASALKLKYYEAPHTEITVATAVTGTVGVAQLQSIILSDKIMVECTNNKFSGEIEAGGKSKGKIEFGGCELYQIKEGKKEAEGSSCEVTVPTFKFKDKLIEGTKSGVVEDEFEPETPPIFVELVIITKTGQTCIFGEKSPGKKYKTEGTYQASFGDEGERALKEHELVFDAPGSNVTFGKEKASYTDTVKKLEAGGKEFYVE
jgi:hypothetical protein